MKICRLDRADIVWRVSLRSSTPPLRPVNCLSSTLSFSELRSAEASCDAAPCSRSSPISFGTRLELRQTSPRRTQRSSFRAIGRPPKRGFGGGERTRWEADQKLVVPSRKIGKRWAVLRPIRIFKHQIATRFDFAHGSTYARDSPVELSNALFRPSTTTRSKLSSGSCFRRAVKPNSSTSSTRAFAKSE